MCCNTYTITELNDYIVKLKALHAEKAKIQSKIDELTDPAVALYERLAEDDKKTVRVMHDIISVNNGTKKVPNARVLSEKTQKKLLSLLDPVDTINKGYTASQLSKMSPECAEAVATETGHKKSITFKAKKEGKK